MRKKEIDPFDWDNISIEKYYKILDILNDEGDDDITKNVKLLSVILDKDESEIWDMDLSEVGLLINRLKFMTKFELPKNTQMKVILPDYTLQVMKDLTKISVAQYVDYQNFITLPLRDSLDKILSVFLIPEGCKYNEGYDVLDVQKQIRENLSFRAAEGLLGFFLQEYGELLLHSLGYCIRKMKKMKDPVKRQEIEDQKNQVMNQLEHLMSLIGC